MPNPNRPVTVSLMTDWKAEHDAELGLRKEWSARAQKAEAEVERLRRRQAQTRVWLTRCLDLVEGKGPAFLENDEQKADPDEGLPTAADVRGILKPNAGQSSK